MNERIRELMIQSMIETGRYQDVQKTYEKFAELIIEECVDYAFANGDNVDYLKQYFGVE